MPVSLAKTLAAFGKTFVRSSTAKNPKFGYKGLKVTQKLQIKGVGRGGYLGSLFDLSDVHVIDHVTARGPSCRYLLGAFEPLRFFLIEYHMYHFHQTTQ